MKERLMQVLKKREEKEFFYVQYDNETSCLNAKTFDISPIINKQKTDIK